MKRILFTTLLYFFCFHVIGQSKTYNITAFGAQPDGKTNNSNAIQKAIDKAAANGGGKVNIPKGRFVTGFS